jgi:phosphate transport system protein
MQLRERFHRQLNELRSEILAMGSQVEEQLHLSLAALSTLDGDKIQAIYALDEEVNRRRYAVEDSCFNLIAMQHPTASDLRLVLSALAMAVDLERMGDQTKGIAKAVRHMRRLPATRRPALLEQMGLAGGRMLRRAMSAYAESNAEVARTVPPLDEEVDNQYARIYADLMMQMAQSDTTDEVEAIYEILRSARELERFGDLAANVAERVVYLVTGSLEHPQDDDA